jgi:hypothetical protein
MPNEVTFKKLDQDHHPQVRPYGGQRLRLPCFGRHYHLARRDEAGP